MTSNNFRDMLFPLDSPRFVEARKLNAREFGDAVRKVPEVEKFLLSMWRENLKQPYQGLTCDGRCQHDLYSLRDEGAPTKKAANCALRLLSELDANKREKLCFPIDSEQWRVWSNPEFLVNDYGLRLDNQTETIQDLVLSVLEASLSPRGLDKTQGCMRTNAFLGELTKLENIMNEWSYNFLLFGEPGTDTPWGWSLYGHHLCLNCFFINGQMVITPAFMGAEPNIIDSGDFSGTLLFDKQETIGLDLMRSLNDELNGQAQLFTGFDDPKLPESRYNRFDGFHLGGASQDNRVVPYEGALVKYFNRAQQKMLMDITAAFFEILPDQPLSAKMNDIEKYLDQTRWCWIGGSGDDDPFYYRIQSPVVMLEFDHHPGVWLSNQAPAKCHIHTVIRTPNGNDYGKDLLRQHYTEFHPDQKPGY